MFHHVTNAMLLLIAVSFFSKFLPLHHFQVPMRLIIRLALALFLVQQMMNVPLSLPAIHPPYFRENKEIVQRQFAYVLQNATTVVQRQLQERWSHEAPSVTLRWRDGAPWPPTADDVQLIVHGALPDGWTVRRLANLLHVKEGQIVQRDVE